MAHTHDSSEGAAMGIGLIAGIVIAVLLVLLLGGVLIARPLLQDSGPRPGSVATQPAGGASGATPAQGGGVPSPAGTRSSGAGGETPATMTPSR